MEDLELSLMPHNREEFDKPEYCFDEFYKPLRWLYFEYMLCKKNPNIDQFKLICSHKLNELMDKIHEKFEDNFEVRIKINKDER